LAVSDGTKIEWTDATWNVVNGCTVVSPGCAKCYAMKQAHRFPVRQGLTRHSPSGMTWTGEVRFNEAVLDQPLRWKRPRRIFVCAHGDLFHDKVPDEWIDRVFAVMALAPQHTFQVLTKRPERMRDYVRSRVALQGNIGGCAVGLALQMGKQVFGGVTTTYPARSAEARELVVERVHNILPNVWLGTSVEDQQRADERIPILLDTPAAVRWVSMEPLLGPVDLTWVAQPDEEREGVIDALLGCDWIDGMGIGIEYRPTRPGHEGRVMTRRVVSSSDMILAGRKIDWVVAGGESGPGARPMHPTWVRSIRDQCRDAQVPLMFKQWGEYAPVDLRHVAPTDEEGGRVCRIVKVSSDPRSMHGKIVDMDRVGKRAAGRMLDGVQHDGYPA
jgi:protein gp37